MRVGAAFCTALVGMSATLSTGAPTGKSRPPTQQVETTRYDWLGNGSVYEFIIEEASGAENRDSPEEQRLRIVDPRGGEYIFTLPGGVVSIHDGVLDHSTTSDNLIASKYIYLVSFAVSAKVRPALMVFGWAYGSDPGSILVLGLDRAGKPVEEFRSETFDLEEMTDLNHDGVRELVGRHSLPQAFGGCCATYDPYSVYELPTVGGALARYSNGMSRSYTVSKYGGWSGPHTREDLVVVPCAPGGSKVMTPKAAGGLCRN